MRSKLLLVVVLLLLTSCSQVKAQIEGAQVSVDPDTASTRALLETVDWGNLNGMVSVLVRNPTDRTLRRADAVITLQNTMGVTVASSMPQSFEGRCCTAVDVPPGGTFGFYLYAGPSAADVTGVEVRYKNVSWESSGSAGGPSATAEPVTLLTNESGSVVAADVTTVGGPIDAAQVQAQLNGPDGEFLAVISGTWYCFVPGRVRRIWMQLYQQAPEGSTVAAVTVFPKDGIPGVGDANPAQACTSGPSSTAAPAQN